MICSLLLLFWRLEANSTFVLLFLSASITTFLKCLQVFSCAAFTTGPSLIIHKMKTGFHNCLLKLSFLMLAAVMVIVYGDHCWSRHPTSPQFLCACITSWFSEHLSQTLQENPLGRGWFYLISMAPSPKGVVLGGRDPTARAGRNKFLTKTAVQLPSSWPLLVSCPAAPFSGFLSPQV